MMSRKRKRGSSIVETSVGLIFLIPIVLLLVDSISLVIAHTANDSLCKECCRAAAECDNITSGTAAAQKIIDAYNLSGSTLTTSASAPATFVITGVADAAGNAWQNVYCSTTVTVNMPVPVPFTTYNHIPFKAETQEAVVSSMALPGS